jgi:glucose/arabinose dehydrogenase
VGSPDPPLPYQTVNAFPKLKTAFPITIVPEPKRDSFLLLENNGYGPVRKSRLLRIPNHADVTDPEVLLECDESIYDACFHPRFAENGYVFIGANGRFGEGRMDFNDRLLRYTMNRATGRIDPASRTVLLEFQSNGHNGMALAFGKDGMLYVTSGDGTSDCDEWNSGQDLTRLLAKLLRIDVGHPANGKPYGIPADNPFLHTEGARPETWAYGFRNPWRMTMDRVTGDLWVGENGQDLWEYARIARRGENYGWSRMEGSHEMIQSRKAGPTPFTKPLIEHSHTDFRSLTGGIVYRGAKFADLTGCYVYGDYGTGQIWAARQKDNQLIEDKCIADTPFGITNFCETPQGDILIVDYLGNAVHRLERHIDTTTAPRPPFPSRLSDTGLFTDVTALKPHPALIPYEINAPAWNDGAASQRFIALPQGERMEFMERNGWNLPNGAALVQTLSKGGKPIETRVLLRQQNEWAGYTYAWNDAHSDATLVPKEGTTRDGWRYPGRQECAFCHSRAVNFVLGVSTVQLNRGDQLARWEREGLLKCDHSKIEEAEWRTEFEKQNLNDTEVQARMNVVLRTDLQREPARDSPLLPHAAGALPRIVDPTDKLASVHDRVRAYLHANCSHCHVRSGGGNSKMQLASYFDDTALEILGAEPMHGTFGIPEVKLAAPGAPERSLVIYRAAVRGPGQMPPVGSMKVDAEGVALLSQWLAGMKQATIAR